MTTLLGVDPTPPQVLRATAAALESRATDLRALADALEAAP